MSKDYTLEQQGGEITNLDDMSKLNEAFTMAETGAIAYVEEFNGKKFVIMTLDKFNDFFEQLEKLTKEKEDE